MWPGGDEDDDFGTDGVADDDVGGDDVGGDGELNEHITGLADESPGWCQSSI